MQFANRRCAAASSCSPLFGSVITSHMHFYLTGLLGGGIARVFRHDLPEDFTRQPHIREPLEPGERLAVALSYLASGHDIKEVTLAYRVGIETARLMWPVEQSGQS
ncbi:uncharacterized protein LOC142574434 [Dermacentor variabilis]|uniref:uncharacterized protein LOC142574434 n=1 Tax=Dermacentor variabilis TaxID=34621 RepID=UPI003F5CAD79